MEVICYSEELASKSCRYCISQERRYPPTRPQGWRQWNLQIEIQVQAVYQDVDTHFPD